MNSKKILNVLILIILVIVGFGCVESTGTNPNDNVSIKILSPLTRDTVEVGRNSIAYEVTNPANKALANFFVIIGEDEVAGIFEAEGNKNETAIYLDIDSAYLGKKIDYFVQIEREDKEQWPTSDVQENLYVGESTSPPEGGGITLTLRKDNSSTQPVFTAILEWTDTLKHVRNYEIYKKEGDNDFILLDGNLSSSTKRYFDHNLSSFGIYSYKVRAKNAYGYSEFSNTVSTGDSPDQAPQNLEATAIGATRIKLSWTDNPIPKQGYDIERRTDGASTTLFAGGTLSEYFDSGLQPSTTYQYRIRSITDESESEWSNYASATTWETDIDEPQNLRATYESETRCIKVTWEDFSNGDAASTVIERSSDNGNNFIEIGSAESGVEEYLDCYDPDYSRSIQENTGYIYRAYHTTSQGNITDYSNEDDAFVPLILPVAPSGLESNQISTNEYILTWDWSDSLDIEITGYNIYKSPFPYFDEATAQPEKQNIGENNRSLRLTLSSPTATVETYAVKSYRVVDGKLVESEFSNAANDRTLIDLNVWRPDAAQSAASISFNYVSTITPTYFVLERKRSDKSDEEYEVLAQIYNTSSQLPFTDDSRDWNVYDYRVYAVYPSGNTSPYYIETL